VTAAIRRALRQRAAGLLALAFSGCLSLQAFAQGAWSPTRAVEFVVGATPGGGTDRTARVLLKIWRDMKLVESIVVVNKVGGGGSLAYSYAHQHPGDGHYIVVARIGLLTGHMLGRSPIGYGDLTPLGVIANEPMALAVRADSPIRAINDLTERWRADPQSVSVSLGSSRGGNTHFFLASVARAAGVDPRRLKTLTFGGAADSITQLLGGHIDMMSATVDNVVSHHQSGRFRVVGIATSRRVAALPDVPTAKEQGFDIALDSWVAVMGPPGLNPAQVTYWERLLERGTYHAEWKNFLEASATERALKNAQQTREYLRAQNEFARAMLIDIGMLK